MFLKRYLQSEEGMSLIEVMVGITLLSIALIPILNYFGNSTKFTYQTGLRNQALNLAEAKMEEVKSKDFDGIDSEPETTVTGYSNFEREVEVTTSYNGNSGLKKISVIVSWDGKSVKLQTLIAKR